MNQATPASHLGRFICLYGMANAGAFIAFVPLLTFILPLKIEQIEPNNKLLILSIIMCAGAVAASIFNILAGWVSDKIYERTHNRMGQISLAMIAVFVSYLFFSASNSWPAILAAILFFQLSFNFLFSPMGALLADHIPNSAKGLTAAILNLGMPIGTVAIAILTLPFFETEKVRLAVIAATIFLLITPLIIFKRPVGPKDNLLIAEQSAAPLTKSESKDLLWAWIGRFAVQFSGAVLFGYILYYLQDIVRYTDIFPTERIDQAIGKLTIIATPIAVVFGLSAGLWSDRKEQRKPFLITFAIVICLAMLSLAFWPTWIVAIIAYTAFATSLTAYLTIDAALVTQILSQSPARAKILGYMNLTNTIPAILTPALAILFSQSGLQGSAIKSLLMAAAILAFIGAFAVTRIRSVF